MPFLHNLVGQRFGRLLVVAQAKSGSGGRRWECVCDCGSSTNVSTTKLQRGKTTACGCQKGRGKGAFRKTHGLTKTTEYRIWCGIIERCANANAPNYSDYGGRGILVCQRWKSFECFYEDMGRRPSRAHSLDRIDNDGGYEPGNCRWATQKEQNRNKRTNRIIDINGRRQCSAAWAEEVGISRSLLMYRVKAGWSEKDILAPPIRKGDPL